MRKIPAIAMRHGLDVLLVPNAARFNPPWKMTQMRVGLFLSSATVRFGRIPRCSGAEDHFSSKRNGEEISS
jgi:hypothetical protein